jgi:hypothetical protein
VERQPFARCRFPAATNGKRAEISLKRPSLLVRLYRTKFNEYNLIEQSSIKTKLQTRDHNLPAR